MSTLLDPAGLFELAPSRPVLEAPVLVQALDGFVDAGNGTRLARDSLLEHLQGEVVATFDVDQLFDYRARRPEMVFNSDHWQSYATPQLQVHALTDLAGTQFLLLSGPEPDAQWERFAAAVELLMRQLGVSTIVGLTAIPMGVPHTRATTVIAHGTPSELVADYRTWLQSVQVTASAGHLLEFRLGAAGFQSIGFAANVPHYVAHLDYPAAAVTLLDCVARAGQLQLPTAALTEAAAQTRIDIDKQVSASAEVAAVVKALEEQYDGLLASSGSSLLAEGAQLPTADEIGAEFERYLSQHREEPDED